ncbi:hypothetical protein YASMINEVIRUS_921 [Yasminevirus sp. GU-2018]|uniref:Uncharacterized protein n=1 Tax=Yasminevirus sp. GU-2018 TaxID=2420051 RepID=A0A5K0U8R2_9VIRU|nr:hypothetical protein YASMINEVIRUS_921 [Yasminevirus sp. GU-2018]
MSRIGKYHTDILKFLKTKSFINDTTEKTKSILYELLELTDHVPAILCLTTLNNQCKKYDIKIHGYYLAAGVDVLMILAQVCSSRDYFDNKYGQIHIDNMIMEVVSAFYRCITQNIETLRLSKNGNVNTKLTQLCIEYASKYIPLITQKGSYDSTTKMKKTDLFCLDIKDKDYVLYKKKNKLAKNTLMDDMTNRYGSVCKLALCLGWILGQGDDSCINKLKDLSDEKTINKLEKLGEHMGRFLKLHDDFKYIERDIKNGRFSLNYVVNYGIKEAYIELTESKANFIEGSMVVGVETKTSKEIIAMIVKNVDDIMKDTSVDFETQYDDVSTL